MLRCFTLRLAAVALAVLGASRAADAPKNFGQIKAMCVIGEVNAINQDDKTVTPLHNEDLLFQNYMVKTGDGASVVLVFSNGATVRLGTDTELIISEFLQDPFPGEELAVGKLEAEPVVSSTKLRFVKGELIGHVVKLRHDSSYTVYTPIGAAGVRGTTYRHVYRPAANGNALFASATGEGEVEFTALNGEVTHIRAGLELSGHTRARRGGFAQFGTHDIARRTSVIIDHHVRVMRVHRARVVFRRGDTKDSKAASKPPLKRDPQSKRETVDDTKDIEREVQEREKDDADKQARVEKAQRERTPRAKKKG